MPYKYNCILPSGRIITVNNGRFLAVEHESPAQAVPNIKLHLRNGSSHEVSQETLGEIIGFNYAPFLYFLHESELRSCSSLGLDASSGIPTSSSLNISYELESGYINPNISVKYIGMCEGVDVGYGVFADSAIASSRFIGEYVGILSSACASASSAYSVNYPGGLTCMAIHAEEQGNLTRLINHSNAPNCQLRHILHDDLVVHVVCMTTDRGVDEGEQLTIDYGASYWKHSPTAPVPLSAPLQPLA